MFTDLALPDSHGLETFQRLHGEADDVPIVVLTEFEDDATAYEAVRLGAQDCLVEGQLDATVLGRAMRYALARFAYDDGNRRSHQIYRTTLDESDVPRLVSDAAGRVLYFNEAAREALGDAPVRVEGAPGEPRPKIEFVDAPSRAVRVRTTDTLWAGQLATLITLRVPTESSARIQAAPASIFEGLVTASPRMRKLFHTCARIAPSSATVLLQGETGTGKELIARAIHKRSGRKGRFVAIDCGAVQETLIDSELFGHERGAFTGATSRKLGLIRHAHQGTLLLDEIGNMPLVSQHSLLRVLQEGVVRPLGSTDEISVDVRVIAASSASLFEAVREHHFREDLLYRLDVIRFELLPLRERPEDVLHLLREFLDHHSKRYDIPPPELGPGFLQAAVDYPWPGNVRQLQNFAERLLLTGEQCFSTRDFHEGTRPATRDLNPRRPDAERVDLGQPLHGFLVQQEEAYLRALLQDTRGSLPTTADRAGVDPRTLRRKLRRFGIDRTRFLH